MADGSIVDRKIDEEIHKRAIQIMPRRTEFVDRIDEISLADDEVISAIRQVNGFKVDVIKKKELMKNG